MSTKDWKADLTAYAEGRTSLSSLRARGYGSYLSILNGLRRLGLRPPMAPLEGPTVEMRLRAKALIAERLRRR